MSKTILAATVGNPAGGALDDPWPPDRPAVGERVAVFGFDVVEADGAPERLRAYHLTPLDVADAQPVGTTRDDAQGIDVRWVRCGTGTVVRHVNQYGHEHRCEVLLDEPEPA